MASFFSANNDNYMGPQGVEEVCCLTEKKIKIKQFNVYILIILFACVMEN